MFVKVITDKNEYINLWKDKKLSILQSWEWGQVKEGGWNPIRLSADNIPVSILVRKLPFGGKFGYIPRGFSSTTINNNLLNELINYSKNELGLTHLIVDPDLSDASDIGKFKNVGFHTSGTTIQPNHTNIVDLQKTEEELFMMMKGNYRRNIKKSERDGCCVEVIESGEVGVERFYRVMETIFKRTSYVMFGIEYFKKVWSILSENKMARIYIAAKSEEIGNRNQEIVKSAINKDNRTQDKNKNELLEADSRKLTPVNDVGAYLVAFDELGAYEFYGGVTDEGRGVEAGYLLKWEAIKDAKKLGKEFYDHWGIAPILGDDYDRNHELYHISKFKEGFGGEVKHFIPQQTIIFKPLPYQVYRLGELVNKCVLKAKKRVR